MCMEWEMDGAVGAPSLECLRPWMGSEQPQLGGVRALPTVIHGVKFLTKGKVLQG